MMKARRDKNNRMFHELAADLAKVRPGSADTMCCPLCLREFTMETIGELSLEHAIPSALGGTVETLTCKVKCNNRQGSKLDSHLVAAMKAVDGMEGKEPMKMRLDAGGGHIAGEVFWTNGGKETPRTFRISRKASNPNAVSALRSNLADHSEFSVHINFGFNATNYWRAAIRAAYLSVFSVYGYEYAFSEGAAQVRRVLSEEAPVLDTVVMEAFPEQEPPDGPLIMPGSFNDVGQFIAALLPLGKKHKRYLTVFLPGKAGCEWSSLGLLYKHAPRLRFETTPATWKTKLFIHLNFDPVRRLQESASW